MIELYKPDMYRKSIYDIDFKKLKSYGIKCILFDLDNTLVTPFGKKISRKLKDYIEGLKDSGFKVIIFSNSGKKTRLLNEELEKKPLLSQEGLQILERALS